MICIMDRKCQQIVSKQSSIAISASRTDSIELRRHHGHGPLIQSERPSLHVSSRGIQRGSIVKAGDASGFLEVVGAAALAKMEGTARFDTERSLVILIVEVISKACVRKGRIQEPRSGI